MTALHQPIRLGMVGGGQGAFMGYVHRIAARLDGDYRLVAGALSSRAEVARASGAELGLAPDRIYADFAAMARTEAIRPDGIEAVAIVTPNHLHFAPAKAFLEAGIHVICDKPMTATLQDAIALGQVVPQKGARFLLTHTYSGYPMVREARDRVRAGQLGDLRMVQVEYAQDWLADAVSSKQADWRTDPAKAGAGGCIGDIGTHAYHLARYVTGLETEAVSADLTAFVAGRRVDDNVNMLLRFRGGARGMLWASQVAVGCENALAIRVFGTKAGLEWRQESPNELWFTPFGQPRQRLTRGGAGTGAAARLPAGHPEGYLEAFATLYRDFAAQIRGAGGPGLPGLADGIEGMRFISAAIASSRAAGGWTTLEGQPMARA